VSQDLATQLREGTQKAHTMAENADFIKCFLKGVVDKSSYRKLVGNFYFVYAALEQELTKHQDHPVLGKLYYRDLWRQNTLERDLAYYYGTDWRNQVQPSVACQKYVKRLQEISEKQPELLVAHAYTRYMGDLSGGQILKKIAKQAMKLEGGNGTAFYEFETIKNHGEFKKQYRAALSNLPVDADMAEKIVEEANHAFHLNMEMFQELKGNWLVALVRIGWNSLISKFQPKAGSSLPSSQSSVG
jgi:heme oxygenase